MGSAVECTCACTVTSKIGAGCAIGRADCHADVEHRCGNMSEGRWVKVAEMHGRLVCLSLLDH